MAIAADCKSAPSGFGGSSPPPPTDLRSVLEGGKRCSGAARKPENFGEICGSSSVGRASAFQAEGREFEPRFPLTDIQ